MSRRTGPALWWLLPVSGSLLVLGLTIFSAVQTRRASSLLLKGESWAVLEKLRGVTPEDPLEEALARSGATWMGFVRRDGTLIAEAGRRPEGWEEAVRLRPGMVRLAGGSGWAVAPPPPPHDDREQLPDRRPPPPILVRFEPVLSRRLERTSAALLVAGLLGLAGVVGLTLLTRRLLRSRDETRALLERERHLASLGNMAAVMAHEIRNPLASLKGHAQLLLESAADRPDEAAMARHVVEGAQRLERISTSLLDLARAGSLERTPVDVEALLAAVAAKDLRITLEVPRAVTWSLDPLRMRQVLENLVDNALQSSADGPVTLACDEASTGLVIDVRDEGPGVPAEDRARIFEPFVTTRVRGTGLGLSIARRLVTLHGGRLELVDVPQGALFRITIPREA